MDKGGYLQEKKERARTVMEDLTAGIPGRYRDSARLFIFLLVAFTVFSHTIGDNENSRFDMTASIVEEGTVAIDSLHNNTGDKALIDGTYYTNKPPLSSLMAVPSYILVDAVFGGGLDDDYYLESFRRSFSNKMEWGRFAATVSVSGVAGALTAALLFLIFLQLGLGRGKATALGLVSGAGTMIFPYSTTFHGTMLGTAFLTASVFIWLKQSFTVKRRAVTMALLVGLGVSSSYLVAIPGGLLLFIFSARRIRDTRLHAVTGTGLFLGLLPLLAFNYITTGNPILPTILYSVPPDVGATSVGGGSGLRQGGSIISLRQDPGIFIARSLRTLFSPLNGLFAYAPVLLFGIAGLRKLRGENRELFYLVTASLAAMTFFTSLISFWLFRAYYGPRYLLPVSTLLLVPIAVELRDAGRLERAAIYVSGLLSTVFMLASTQPWRGVTWTSSVNKSEFVSLGIYENRLGEYLAEFATTGLQSPLVSYITGASPDFHTVLSAYPEYVFPAARFYEALVLVDTRALIAAFLATGAFLLFRKHLNGTGLDGRHLAGLLLVLLFMGVSSSTFYMHGWYDERENKTVKWGRQSPDIYFSSRKEGTRLLEMKARTYERKDFEVLLNGDRISNVSITPRGRAFRELLEVREGVNRLSFRTDRCNPVGRFAGNDDARCVTLGLMGYNLTDIRKEVLTFDSMEKDSQGYRRVKENSRIITAGSGLYSLELDLNSPSRNSVRVTMDGEVLTGAMTDDFPVLLNTPYVSIDGPTVFRIEKSCSDCRVEISDARLKEYSKQPETLLYRLGTNWYQPVEGETYTWSTGNSSVYIYNYRDEPVNKTLWVQGRSFSRERRIEFMLNGKKLRAERVPATAYRVIDTGEKEKRIENKFGFDVVLEPGENVLEFRTTSSCRVIGEVVGNEDIRCALYGFKNLYLVER